MTPITPEELVAMFGTQTKTARALGVSKQSVWQCLNRTKRVPELWLYRLRDVDKRKHKIVNRPQPIDNPSAAATSSAPAVLPDP